MCRVFPIGVTLSLTLCLFGCGPTGPQGGPRIKTIPVRGVVHVNGEPASFLRISAVSTNAAASAGIEHAGMTIADGSFSLSTYESGDGVPPGSYALTFTWGEINLMNGQYSGDKLNGKFADASRSEHTLQVSESDKDIDLGTIDLKN